MDLPIYSNSYSLEYNYDIFTILNQSNLIIQHNNKSSTLKICDSQGKVIGCIFKCYVYKLFDSIFFKLLIYNNQNQVVLMIKQSFNQVISVYIPSKHDDVYFKQIGKVNFNLRNYKLYTEKHPFAEINLIPQIKEFPLIDEKNFTLGCVDLKWLKKIDFNAYNVRFDLSRELKTRILYENFKSNMDFFQRAVFLSTAISIDFGTFLRRD